VKSRIVIVETDRSTRKFLEAACSVHHAASAAGDLKSGLKLILKLKPVLVVAGLDTSKKMALQLMRYMKQYKATMPVLVIGGRGAGALQMAATKAGAKGYLEFPVDQARLDREISRVLQADLDSQDSIPAITDEEKSSNLTVLENDLNRQMKCPSGRNQVYLQSLIVGLRKTKPRIALKCPMRREFGMRADVYYEYIRDVCCSDPTACPAVQQFHAKNSA
jgi:DNA-binding response OmpR family regulator